MSSGTPYIGSKISLISKAKIRYEGFLYTIDQNESTVTLAKVISLGTEDRCPEAPVPAREEIFEYIVFRGHDIDDLHVCEGPKRVDDPAIVHNGPVQQTTPAFPTRNAAFQPTYGPFAGNMPPFGYSNFMQQSGVPDQHATRQKTPPNLPRTPTPEQKSNVRDENTQNQSNQRSKSENNRSRDHKENTENKSKGQSDYRGNVDYQNKNRNSSDRRDYKDYRSSRDKKETSDRRDNKDTREYRDNRRDNKFNRDNKRDERDTRTEKSFSSEHHRRGGPSRGRGNRGGTKPRGGGNRPNFTEDFDFESANSKFHKEEIEKELLNVLNKVKVSENDAPSESTEVEEKDKDDLDPLPSPDKFYDRSKSFFDNISCEAMTVKSKSPSEDNVMTRRQERALNAETFGTTGYYRRGGYRGRGPGRGRGRGRGRGGWRGRGGAYRGNSNRSWVDYEFDYEAAGIKAQKQNVKT